MNLIFRQLQLAWKARLYGAKYTNILLEGDAGLGKSAIVSQFCSNNNLQLIDLRAALLERPDLLGLPIAHKNELVYAIPSFLPKAGSNAVVFFDELNRAPVSIQNAVFQLLTKDKMVSGYTIPTTCMIVAAINPNNDYYAVNEMETALRNRFITINVDYNRENFVNYIRSQNWNNSIISYINSVWQYVSPKDLRQGETYVSPRSWEQLQESFELSKDNPELQNSIIRAILGVSEGEKFMAHIKNDKPIMYVDLIKDYKSSINALLEQSKDVYRGDKITVTIDDLEANFGTCDKSLIYDVAKVIPRDLAVNSLFSRYLKFLIITKATEKKGQFSREQQEALINEMKAEFFDYLEK